MWKVEPPDFTVKECFTACVSKVTNSAGNKNLKDRFKQVLPLVIAESDQFELHAAEAEMFLVPQADSVNGIVTTKEMVGLYDGRMAKKNGPGRPLYTRIKLLPEHDRCPFCDHRDVSTLDHILPKTLFPALAVTPLNLVGSCKDCNFAKRTQEPTNANDTVLHPYFDDVSDCTWLTARILEQDVCAVLFTVRDRNEWSSEKNARLKAQFKTLGLNKLYSSQAARELSGIRGSLIQKHHAGGAAAVKYELNAQWRSRRTDRRNCWQTALYRALSKNDWYCDGGFRLGR